jgi:hypothetical protein
MLIATVSAADGARPAQGSMTSVVPAVSAARSTIRRASGRRVAIEKDMRRLLGGRDPRDPLYEMLREG